MLTLPRLNAEPDNRLTDNRLTEFYDQYIDSYGDSNQPLPPIRSGGAPPAPPDRVAAWARTNANPNSNPNYPPSRSGSRSAPASNYTPSSFGGGGTLRRKVTRRTARTPGRIQSTYEEEEEGYASGDYDDVLFELAKIRVKVSFTMYDKHSKH